MCSPQTRHLRASDSSPKANILINKDRRACIADFGLSTITGVATHASARASRTSLISNDTLMSFTAGGTYRWMSPELLHPERYGMPESEGNRPTRQSDCYALGMVIYEVGIRIKKTSVSPTVNW
jgi:serine/threonine protein kinase